MFRKILSKGELGTYSRNEGKMTKDCNFCGKDVQEIAKHSTRPFYTIYQSQVMMVHGWGAR